jgi:hypothetical protein
MRRSLSVNGLMIGLVFLLFACQAPAPPQRAFYHWQTHLQISAAESQRLQALRITRLYTKFFDVDWDAQLGQIVPLASIQIDTQHLAYLEIVPVIFITNRTWDHLESTDQVQELLERILHKIEQVAAGLDFNKIKEIQIDSDWTSSTRRVYFTFLAQLKQALAVQSRLLSVTIRLHQCKYPQRTGVPPADRGMLMLYNVGKLEEWSENNSIFSSQAALAYAPLPAYPLPLDLALPAFSWGVLFREGEMIRLLNELRAEDLRGDVRFREIAPQRFRVQKSTYLEGHYLYAGDLLRIETCGKAELLAAARFAHGQKSAAQPRWLALYHLHPRLFKALDYAALEDVFAVF